MKDSVGATIGRPQILPKQNLSRKAKTPSFFGEKSENLRFTTDEQCSPLQHFDRNLPFSFKSKMFNLHQKETRDPLRSRTPHVLLA